MRGSTTVWIHLIWQTQSRRQVFADLTVRRLLSRLLYRSFRAHSMQLRMNAVRPEHVHLLTLLPATVSLNRMVEILQSDLLQPRGDSEMLPEFSWADQFAAFSVSRSQIDEVLRYFSEQNRLHRTLSCAEEWQMLQKLHRS